MYTKGERLIILQDVGEEGKANYLAKDTEVLFHNVIDTLRPDVSFLTVHKEGETSFYTVPELAIKSLENDPLVALAAFNKALTEGNPELGIYHPNFFKRSYYKVKKFFTVSKKDDRLKKEKDLKWLKDKLNRE